MIVLAWNSSVDFCYVKRTRFYNQVHLKLRTVSCRFCPYGSSAVKFVNAHIKRKHPEKVSEMGLVTLEKSPFPRRKPGEARDVMCDRCSHRAKSQSALQKHVASVHEKRLDFVCEECARPFATAGRLKSHIDSVHKGTCVL